MASLETEDASGISSKSKKDNTEILDSKKKTPDLTVEECIDRTQDWRQHASSNKRHRFGH